MTDPMSDERLAEIRRAWDGVDATSHRLTVTNTRTPGQLLHALSRASQDVPALLAEIKRLRAELATVRDKKALARAYAEVQGFAQRETARAERLAEQVRVLAGVLKRGRPEVHCTKHPDQPDSDCETCRDVETFRAALDGTEADRG